MSIQRLEIEPESGGPLWVAPEISGTYVYWSDVADLVIKASSLIARIELAHDLHAVFTIKDSDEFLKLKSVVSDTLKQ